MLRSPPCTTSHATPWLVALFTLLGASVASARPADLAAEPTPAALSWDDVERMTERARGERARQAELDALDRRLAALQAKRARAPMAKDAVHRDQEIAEVLRDRALLRWHRATICAEQANAPRRGRKAPPPCPAADFAPDEAIAAYHRALGAYPNHLRGPELRVQLAVFELRAARARNELPSALRARTALQTLARELAPSSIRRPAEHWLAEDDANAGRIDLAQPQWRALATATPRHAYSDYALYRMAHAQWQAGEQAEAMSALSTLSSRGAKGHAAVLGQAATSLRRWMAARLEATRRAAEKRKAQLVEAVARAAAERRAEEKRAAKDSATEGPARRPTGPSTKADAGRNAAKDAQPGEAGADAEPAKSGKDEGDAAKGAWPRRSY
ncbi:MAG: hypothetical protein H6747_16040 [Deltaproteobacteria bacterium]|nr:hypothetical protein [Deltaproteobacteria bacterium]